MLRTLTILLAVAFACLAACSGDGERVAAREVGLAEFARPADATLDPPRPDAAAADPGVPGVTTPAPAGADAPAPGPGTEPGTGAEAGEDAGFPPFPAEPADVDRDIVVDSLVGQVNGRPIFADAFFAPIEDELLAIAERSAGPIAFENEASQVVIRHLRQVVLSELFLAEAESSLTAQQQEGLLAWMRNLRENIISEKGGGTRADAEARLREQEAMGVEEYVDSIRDQALTAQLWREEIQSRVIVSWRDVEREYQRRYEEFNPPTTVSLARIRMRSASPEDLEQVTTLLDSGLPFAEVATRLGMDDGGAWDDIELGPGGLADVELSSAIKEHLEGLDVGETSPPFELGTSTWWLHVSAINRPEGRSIYEQDVQRELAASIRARRESEEERRFVDSLLEKGIYDELEDMGERLFQIARLRYGPR